jgi:hypothetical protein
MQAHQTEVALGVGGNYRGNALASIERYDASSG